MPRRSRVILTHRGREVGEFETETGAFFAAVDERHSDPSYVCPKELRTKHRTFTGRMRWLWCSMKDYDIIDENGNGLHKRYYSRG